MSDCPGPCGHPRLVHDSFGCKICKANCAISIIYLTDLFAKVDGSHEDMNNLLLASVLDAKMDREDEARIKIMLERAAEELEMLRSTL